jgi:glutamine---fructose-6-phosphate transaminase (isomerizing)
MPGYRHRAPLCPVRPRKLGQAGVFLRYLIEARLHLPVSANTPSVILALRKPLTLGDALFIVISQSGRSPDPVAETQSARASGARCCDRLGGAVAGRRRVRRSNVPIEAGP